MLFVADKQPQLPGWEVMLGALLLLEPQNHLSWKRPSRPSYIQEYSSNISSLLRPERGLES